MTVLAVSTFNASGLEQYGRRMMRTFDDHWPEAVRFRVYSEGWSEDIDRGEVICLERASPWLADFKERHRFRQTRDYRMDAVRFAHKAAAICHAARAPVDWLVWLDGDVVTHTKLPAEVLRDWLPWTQWIAWLDRDRMYPETGVVILNCRHPRHLDAIDAFEAMYAEDRLFDLPEWHDAFVLKTIVDKCKMPAMSLSGVGRKTSHPLVNGPLSAFLDHAKGQRKKAGRTPARERTLRDNHPYWL